MLKPAFLERASKLETINKMVEDRKRGFYLLTVSASIPDNGIITTGGYISIPCRTIKEVKEGIAEIDEFITNVAVEISEKVTGFCVAEKANFKLTKKEIPTQDSTDYKPYRTANITVNGETMATGCIEVIYIDRKYPAD